MESLKSIYIARKHDCLEILKATEHNNLNVLRLLYHLLPVFIKTPSILSFEKNLNLFESCFGVHLIIFWVFWEIIVSDNKALLNRGSCARFNITFFVWLTESLSMQVCPLFLRVLIIVDLRNLLELVSTEYLGWTSNLSYSLIFIVNIRIPSIYILSPIQSCSFRKHASDSICFFLHLNLQILSQRWSICPTFPDLVHLLKSLGKRVELILGNDWRFIYFLWCAGIFEKVVNRILVN